MKLSELKQQLNRMSELNFLLPNGEAIPKHFHITEAGLTSKHFIDCGGTLRTETVMNMQVWVANDTDHRLEPSKLQKIIAIAEQNFGVNDLDIEIEYQTEFAATFNSQLNQGWQTIGNYGLALEGNNFLLTTKHTDCLAKDNCGIPQDKQKLPLANLQTAQSCCAPGGNCC